MTTNHTRGPWRIGKAHGAVVADVPVNAGLDNDHVEAYGGHLIAESIAVCNRPLIAAAPELLDALEDLKSELILSNVDQDYIESHFRRCLNKAAAAIAKATGDRLGQLAAEAAIAKAKGEQQ
ncbi:hypothetical protein [Achromobacter ruhlandii]|uniref:hypothetical protein n=1 Tax=Achromobacter ruhlandii TaxID=72557 RepID=UPI003B9EC78F